MHNSLNSTMFRWNLYKLSNHEYEEISLNSTMFRWNILIEGNLERVVSVWIPLCSDETDEEVFFEIDIKKFEFHYVQMKPPLLTFQTSFNKA